jgi:prepilin-type N-terminal cleavage/methylation domain-containing protein
MFSLLENADPRAEPAPWLQRSTPVMRLAQRGYTLVELMVVIAIVAILASVAIYMFGQQKRKALASEVPVVFAEFRLREEQFHLENDEYLTTGASDDALYPTTDPGRDTVTVNNAATPIPPDPQGTKYPKPSWLSLRMNLSKSAVYCGYVAVSGVGGDDTTIGSVASADPFDFGGSLPVPATDWFYLLAQCDFDGDGVNSIYFTLSGSEGTIVENAGE